MSREEPSGAPSSHGVGPFRRRVALALLGALAPVLLAGCGRSIAPPETPPGVERIVSLAPNLTEILCAIGGADRLVGRSSACDEPADIVARVPVAGDFGRPSMERLLALRPTLVLFVDLEDKTLPETLRRLGVRHAHIPCKTLDDIPAAIREVGRLAARMEAAEALADTLERGIAERRAAAAARASPPVVFAELWHDPILTVGRGSFISEMIRLAGGRNLGDRVDREYFEVSPEWVLAENPDVLLSLGMAGPDDFRGRLAARPGWRDLKAVKEGRVIADVPPDRLLRPGPRVLEAVDLLRDRLRARASEEVP